MRIQENNTNQMIDFTPNTSNPDMRRFVNSMLRPLKNSITNIAAVKPHRVGLKNDIIIFRFSI